MITKQCQFPGRDEHGVYLHLLHPGYDNKHLIKTAQVSPPQLVRIQNLMNDWPRKSGEIPALVSAMGAGEYWGSNSNGDDFPEEPLIHVPSNWESMDLETQRRLGKSWEWGYPTFYNAHAFQHHVNKDPARAFGHVVYATWDNLMKRILLVINFSRQRAEEQGAIGVIDRVENGEFPDVSMGCKVPFDVCSICADWDRIIPLQSQPKKLLAEHKKNPVRGLSTTRADYCQHLQFELNKIYPDGRKVRMLNLHPKFFDLSVVFIGADKTSKIMAKLAGEQMCPIRNNAPMCKKGCFSCAIPSSHVYEVWARDEQLGRPTEKVAYGFTGPSLGRVLRPVLIGGASGAALGGTAGGVIGAARESDPDERGASALKGVAAGMLGGGLAGAGVGAGIGRKGLATYKKFGPARRLLSMSEDSMSQARAAAKAVDEAAVSNASPSKVYKLERKAIDLADESKLLRSMAVEQGHLARGPLGPIKKTGSDEDALALMFGIDKTAELTMAKKAEIIKQIRSNFSNSMPDLEENEPEIPRNIQDRLSQMFPDALSSAGSMGIVLKPREFQRMTLIMRGHPKLADDLDDQGVCFRPGAEPSGASQMGQVIPKILEMLAPMIQDRSAFGPPMHRRIISITITKKRPDNLPSELDGNPVLDKISSAYSEYRQQLLYKTASLLHQVAHEHPWVISELYGDLPERSFTGGIVKTGGSVVESLIGMFPIDYLNRSYLVQPISSYVDEHCDLAGLETAGELASCGRVA